MYYPTVHPVKPFRAGNSLVVTIPKQFATELALDPGSQLYVTATPDGVLNYGTSRNAIVSTHPTRRQRRRR